MARKRFCFLPALAVIFLTGGVLFACNLPLDPKVVVLPDGGWEKDAWGGGIYGGREGPHVSVVTEEGTTVGFTAYVNVSGVSIDVPGIPYVVGGKSMKLVTLPILQAAAEAKLKFKEMLEEQPGCVDTDPDAVSLGGGIKGMTISGNSSGGHFGEDFNKSGLDSLTGVLPNPSHPNFTETSGNSRWRVSSGKYKHEGKFYFDKLDSTFEFDKSGIMGGEVVKTGGAAGKSSHAFTVPTTGKNPDNPNAFYYACVGKVDIILKFKDIVWTWKEVREEKNASGSWEVKETNEGEVEINGKIERTSEGTNEGHPGYFYVKVKDITPPVYARMVGPTPAPQGTTGEALPGSFDITYDLVDNGPIPDENPIPTDFYYTVAVTDYLKATYNYAGPGMENLKFSEYKDKFIWKKQSATANFQSKAIVYPSKTDYTALPGFDVSGIGKVVTGLITNSVSTWKATFTIPDKMGFHYSEENVDESTGTKAGGQLISYKKGRLKYFVVPNDDGNTCGGLPGFTPPPVDTINEAGAKDACEENSYQATRATFPAPTLNTPPETWEALDADEKIEFAIGNFGTFSVKDNDPPTLFLAIRNTRTGDVHIYGNNTKTLDSGTGPFTGGGQTTDNAHIRGGYPTAFNFAGLDSADGSGYDSFNGSYRGKGYIFHNDGDDNNGYWCEEDEKIEISSWGYDNINTYDPRHGLGTGASGGGPDYTWWVQDMKLNVNVTDQPGGGGGAQTTYIFRDPNRPTSLNSGDCSIEASCVDKGGRGANLKINVFVLWHQKEIRGLEERKNRLQN